MIKAPKVTKPADLFAPQVEVEETNVVRVPGFVNTVDTWQHESQDLMEGGKPFGSAWDGRYVKFKLPNGTQVDLFITTLEQWGYIFLIRTGSADFSKMVASRWSQTGHKGVDGQLTRGGMVLHFREEDELFAHLGLKTPHPSEREMTADGLSKWMM
jgi:hypothetical protein